jgi:class 3 adenylate cyclase
VNESHRNMSAEIKKEIQLEIAHVLFIDIVGYSKVSINDQHAAVEELNRIVRASEQFQPAEAAGRLIRIPTGDGMALAFYTNPEAPAQCAVEISRALKKHPRLQLRMGIHSGPVGGVVDVNEHANLAGAGLNIAHRVMACCDAGHILLSKHVAEDLEGYQGQELLRRVMGRDGLLLYSKTTRDRLAESVKCNRDTIRSVPTGLISGAATGIIGTQTAP